MNRGTLLFSSVFLEKKAHRGYIKSSAIVMSLAAIPSQGGRACGTKAGIARPTT